MRRSASIVAVLAVSALSTGCITPEALKAARPPVDAEVFMSRPAIKGAMDVTVRAADALVPLGMFALGLSCYWRARQGASSFSSAARSYVWSALAAVVILGAWNTAGSTRGSGPVLAHGTDTVPRASGGLPGPDTVVRSGGRWLADQLEPQTEDYRWQGYFRKHESLVQAMLKVREDAGRGLGKAVPGAAAAFIADPSAAVAQFMTEAIGQALIVVNASAAYLMHVIVLAIHGWLVAFYSIVGPLTVPFILWDRTRFVFWGWLKAYISLAMWPALLNVAERINLSLVDVSYSMGSLTTPEQAAAAVISGSTAMAVLNITMIFGYLIIPVAAHMIVNGAGRPFRGVA